jgi:hypothetical protein
MPKPLASSVEPERLGELGVAVGQHQQLLGVLRLAPGIHHEHVVDRHAGDGVDALGLDPVRVHHVARQVRLRCRWA